MAIGVVYLTRGLKSKMRRERKL